MVGSPFQETSDLVQDMLFLKQLHPHMVGIGPFIPHRDTPFAGEKAGTLELTLYMLGLLRLMLPDVFLPAPQPLAPSVTTGGSWAILSGANVVMPNLSPRCHRKDYSLYNNKLDTGAESAEGLSELARRMEQIGYRITVHRATASLPDQA